MTYEPYGGFCTCYLPNQICPLHGRWVGKPIQEDAFTGTGTTDTWRWYEANSKIIELEKKYADLEAKYEALKAEQTDNEPSDDAGEVREPHVPLHGAEWLSESGLLWLINRQVFHPMGYSLSLAFADDDEFLGIELLGDGKDTWSFSEDIDENSLLERARNTLKPKND